MEVYEKIKKLSDEYHEKLENKTQKRVKEMEQDNLDHYLIYEVLGVPFEEGELIDVYQNKGRFLYKDAGSFVEKAVLICFQEKFGENAEKVKIPNTESSSPKTFEIDCLVNKSIAHEIKWRDATTDGDHISKESRRTDATVKAGYKPVRLMFFKPNRKQSQNVQRGVQRVYEEHNGHYYAGEEAWNYLLETTGIDLLEILNRISKEKEQFEKDKKIAAQEILKEDGKNER